MARAISYTKGSINKGIIKVSNSFNYKKENGLHFKYPKVKKINYTVTRTRGGWIVFLFCLVSGCFG